MTDLAVQPKPKAAKVYIEPNDGEMGIKTDPSKEYVAAGRMTWYADYKTALEHSIDDVTRDFGDDTYQRMMNDPQIASCLNTLKTAILAGGLRINVLDLPDEAPEADQKLAQELADFCDRVVTNLETPVADVLFNMLDALYLGNKVAESVWKLDELAEGGPKLVLRRINVKPRESVAFVVDAFNNVLGILGKLPDVGLPVLQGTFLADESIANLLPREKFFIFTFRPIDNDPRGSSLFRPLYNVWWIAQQLYPEWLKYLAQFATAILVGFTPPGATPVIKENADGTPEIGPDGKPVVIYPEVSMVNTLVQVRNGSVVAFKGGSEVEAIKPGDGGGEAFLAAFALIDKWKSKTILHQTLATEEGEHQARAASEVHQDIFSLLVQSIKEGILLAFRRDVLQMLIRVNYGDEAMRLAPTATLGEIEQVDWTSIATAVTTLFSSKYLDPSQIAHTDSLLGLPVRPPEAIARLLEQISLGIEGMKASIQSGGQTPPGGAKDGEKQPKPLGSQKPAAGGDKRATGDK